MVRMSRQVDLLHASDGHGIDEARRVVAVVDAAHVDVVDVEQQQAVGLLGQRSEEFPLGHGRGAVLGVARDVLEHQAPAERVLRLAQVAHDDAQRLLAVGQRQQVVQLAAVHAGPAQVVRDPQRLHARGERRQGAQVARVEAARRADRHRHAVQHDRVACPHRLEHAQRLAARHQVVLGNHLQPVDAARRLEERRVMRGTQAQAEAG